MLAPYAPLRAAVTVPVPETTTAQSAPPVKTSSSGQPTGTLRCYPARYLWAMLLARICEVFPVTCMRCGAEMRIGKPIAGVNSESLTPTAC